MAEATLPPKSSGPASPAPTRREPEVTLVPGEVPPNRGVIDPNKRYATGWLDTGFHLMAHSGLSAVIAPPGTKVRLRLNVDTGGEVTGLNYCFTDSDQHLCDTVAEVAKDNWRFSPPLINKSPHKAIATVEVKF